MDTDADADKDTVTLVIFIAQKSVTGIPKTTERVTVHLHLLLRPIILLRLLHASATEIKQKY